MGAATLEHVGVLEHESAGGMFDAGAALMGRKKRAQARRAEPAPVAPRHYEATTQRRGGYGIGGSTPGPSII